ncbi:MAG: hypothetical protein HPY65_18020 [Syntrophaceae bacterium]|nr:hypothetical protein [Syntrophaceae bacterium]
MKQKDKLEYHAVINFVKIYNCKHKRLLHFIRQCQPPFPDTICRLNNKEIGIEVAHSYGTGVEAAVRLGNRKMKDFPEKLHQMRRLTHLDVRALGSLNNILAGKSSKTYQFSPTWLIVRNAFMLWSLTDYRKHKKQIVIPNVNPFKQIWLLCDENSIAPQGIMRLQ